MRTPALSLTPLSGYCARTRGAGVELMPSAELFAYDG
jgi:hypothetical protein